MTGAKAWLVVVGLALGVCVSNGFARFAYGLILPAMRDDLGWNFAQAGWINTANSFGYLAGAVATFVLISRFPPAKLFSVGVLATSVFLLLSGIAGGFWALTLWRVLAGMSGATVFIAGSVLVALMFQNQPGRSALAIALYFGGGGLGMIVSGAVLPALLNTQGPGAWPTAWIFLGVTSLLCCPFSMRAAAHFPQEPKGIRTSPPLPIGRMRYLLTSYALFATGYIVYLTFLAAWMRELSVGPWVVSLVWITTGLTIILSPFLWRSVLSRHKTGRPLAQAMALVAIGTTLPVFMPTIAGLFLSAGCFGVSVFIAPSAVTNFSRQNLPQPAWGASVSLFTIVFAIGQTVGPIAAGSIGDRFGSIGIGLASAGAILTLGAAIALLQDDISS